MVSQKLATHLAGQGHELMIGTRNAAETLARTAPDGMGNPPFSAWHKQHSEIGVGTFAEAAAYGEMVFNCTSGMASLSALTDAGETNLNGKILVDVANAFDFSKGMPPTFSVSNTDSLGEQIQRAFPAAKVVKALNTVGAPLMVNPALLASGDHTIFVCGNDAEAKTSVTELLKSFGWNDIVDLGDISAARGTEMLMAAWIRLFGVLRTPMFNFKVAR